jgi:predicted enzyme related to lactoylglutathione lyase
MPDAKVTLAFFKLNVAQMDTMLKFYADAFGFAIVATYDIDEFLEHVLALPGQENGPNLMLVEYKDRRSVSVGPGHGPVGLFTKDIAALHDRALHAGAQQVTGVFSAGDIQIAVLLDPEGHEVELVQLPAA